jgi:hypothetical protein
MRNGQLLIEKSLAHARRAEIEAQRKLKGMMAQKKKAQKEAARLRRHRQELEARYISAMEEVRPWEDEQDGAFTDVHEPMDRLVTFFVKDEDVKMEVADLELELPHEVATFPGSIEMRMTGSIHQDVLQEFSLRHLRMWVVTKGDIFSLYAAIVYQESASQWKAIPIANRGGGLIGSNGAYVHGFLAALDEALRICRAISRVEKVSVFGTSPMALEYINGFRWTLTSLHPRRDLWQRAHVLQSRGIEVRLCSIPKAVDGAVGLQLCTLFWAELANLVARPEGAQAIRINNVIFDSDSGLTVSEQEREVREVIIQRTVEAAKGNFAIRGASLIQPRSKSTCDSKRAISLTVFLVVVKQEY